MFEAVEFDVCGVMHVNSTQYQINKNWDGLQDLLNSEHYLHCGCKFFNNNNNNKSQKINPIMIFEKCRVKNKNKERKKIPPPSQGYFCH